MKRNELTELVWNLQREYLEFDPKVEIRFRGLEYGYGLIAPNFLVGKRPELSDLWACASTIGSDIHSTQLRVISVDGNTIDTREVDWPATNRHQEAAEHSKRGSVAYLQRRYSGTVERLVSWQEVNDLLVSNDEIYLGELSLPTTNTWADDFDLTVFVEGRHFPSDQFHWLPSAQGQILEALLNMKESVFGSGHGLTRQNGFQTLVDDTGRWAAVVQEFIDRHGQSQAEALLGRDTVTQIIAKNGGAFSLVPINQEDTRQLEVALMAPESAENPKN